MTAAGKITTARIQTGDRVLVKHYTRDNEADAATLDYLGKDWTVGIATTKTGQGVEVARVLKVEAAKVTGGRRDKRVYDVYTTAGIISNCAPAQTWTLAPEDAAGVKRAHVEALALNEVMDAYPVAEEAEEAHAELVSTTLDEGQRAEVAAGNPVVITEPAQADRVVDAILAPRPRLGARPTLVILDEVPAFLAQLSINARPALETLARVSQGLGRTLRPVLEEGVRMARDIPEGRRRHGQTKARRDALKHARKLELANL